MGALSVVYNAISLGYDELKSALREVSRRRSRRHFGRNGWIHRKLLEACVFFTRNGFRIVNKMVISRLCVAFRALRIAKGRVSILLDGEIRALEMQVQYRTRGVFKWAPRLETWLKMEGYKFWLGTIQRSLEDSACPIVEVGSRRLRG
jgi:hypothetical protein